MLAETAKNTNEGNVKPFVHLIIITMVVGYAQEYYMKGREWYWIEKYWFLIDILKLGFHIAYKKEIMAEALERAKTEGAHH